MNNILVHRLAWEGTRNAAKSFSESEENVSMPVAMRLCDEEKQLHVRSEPSRFGSREGWNSGKNDICIKKIQSEI